MARVLELHQFNSKPIRVRSVGLPLSGLLGKRLEATIGDKTGKIFQLAGTGDLINAMVTAALAVAVIGWSHHFGALSISYQLW